MINISDVTKIDTIRKQIRKEIYTKIYEQFSRRIKNAAQQYRKDIFLTIPAFVMGYPTFDRFAATKYIERQLVLAGFTVQMVSDYDLYVSWHTSKKESKNEVRQPEEEFPSLVNLKKVANRYRKGA
jgi:hypothetical protein|tara:strand:- start:7498 stop:7875 length:378 start_codon:yes stop_codon:yes gene_type:complete